MVCSKNDILYLQVDAILKAMKHAFAEALEASAHLTLCESCPLQYFHKLCTNLESKYMLHRIYSVGE